jgi:hypothetical protein
VRSKQLNTKAQRHKGTKAQSKAKNEENKMGYSYPEMICIASLVLIPIYFIYLLLNWFKSMNAPRSNIEELKATHNIAALCKSLLHEKAEIRIKAAQVLGELSDYLVVPEINLAEKPEVWFVELVGIPLGEGWFPFEDDEITILGSIPIFLPISQTAYINRYDVKGGIKEQQLVGHTLGSFTSWGATSDTYVVDDALLYITNSRVMVRYDGLMKRYSPNSTMWFDSLHSIQSVSCKKGMLRNTIILNYKDGETLSLETTYPMPKLEEGVCEWNKYLQLLQSGDKASIEQYCQYLKAVYRGSEIARDAIKSKLRVEKDIAVKAAMNQALENLA